ncbi:hypothetical protein Y1Q_0021251 [Alligator mississippiensis]|uniref:Uncharacterized protein n=1 Tax=Alligator mississippiensis TaxID=8496 RepID=A0A151MS23_ALLMI|nr:hypothetical protein Y1Q_0021251 [Alligator mississippiensis]
MQEPPPWPPSSQVNLRKSANDSISALSTILSAAEIQTWHKGAQLPVNLHLYWESQSDAKALRQPSLPGRCLQSTGLLLSCHYMDASGSMHSPETLTVSFITKRKMQFSNT